MHIQLYPDIQRKLEQGPLIDGIQYAITLLLLFHPPLQLPLSSLALLHSLTSRNERYKPVRVQLDREAGFNSWLTCTLTEGRNRELRKIFDDLQMPVSRIIRTQFGPYL